ncbi:MAG: hypothetical protein KU38_07915 [Sulfurovum sp. FS08-3]|nr:MAG: hypothetical protein KU38_07915 [Sulfurovum sp. FS08-3]
MQELSKEEQLIHNIESILDSNDNLTIERNNVEQLLKAYKKNLRQLSKIVKISDRQQNEVNKQNQILHELSQKLSLYLSPQIVQSIFVGKQDAALTTSRKKLTIFFSDLVNFTQTTENLEPELLSSILNDYLDEMVTIALKYGATIDKFIGDGIMLFFGDPDSLGEKEDAMNCISMAIEMRERVGQFGMKWADKGLHEPLQVRMGVATGFVTVGNFGSTHRMDYTIIGSHVNIASRLEQTANPNSILISHETYSLIKDAIYCEKRDTIFLKGILYSIATYEVIDFFENIKELKEINIVNEQLSLYLNKESIKSEDKERIIATLQKVIDEVQSIR